VPEFLGNLDEAAASFNEALDELAALAEVAAAVGAPAAVATGAQHREGDGSVNLDQPKPESGMFPGRWEGLFRRANIQVEGLDSAKSSRARATLLGKFLAQHLDREVAIEVAGWPGKARLLAAAAGKKQRVYHFEITWEGGRPPDPREVPEPREVHEPDDLPGAAARGRAADPRGRPVQPRPREARVDQPLASGRIATDPGASGVGNEEDWS
jgi:hypothetical protein